MKYSTGEDRQLWAVVFMGNHGCLLSQGDVTSDKRWKLCRRGGACLASPRRHHQYGSSIQVPCKVLTWHRGAIPYYVRLRVQLMLSDTNTQSNVSLIVVTVGISRRKSHKTREPNTTNGGVLPPFARRKYSISCSNPGVPPVLLFRYHSLHSLHHVPSWRRQ